MVTYERLLLQLLHCSERITVLSMVSIRIDIVFLNFQQVQKLTSLLDTVVVNAWKANIELTCSKNVLNVVTGD